jgi:hypothetical protein
MARTAIHPGEHLAEAIGDGLKAIPRGKARAA